MILLDTHVLIWLDGGDERLGERSRATIFGAYQSNALAVAAISSWEVGILARKGRIELAMDLQVWRSDLLRSGMKEVCLDGATGLLAAQLDGFHGDPADRIIIAATLQNETTLLTADVKLLQWQGGVSCLDALL